MNTNSGKTTITATTLDLHVYCTRTSVKKSIHAFINEHIENQTPERVRERTNKNKRIESNRMHLLCLLYSVFFCLSVRYAHFLTLFLSCALQRHNYYKRIGQYDNRPHSHTQAHTYARMYRERERSPARSFSSLIRFYFIFSFPLDSLQRSDEKRIHKSQHHRIHRIRYIDRTILQSEPDSCVLASCARKIVHFRFAQSWTKTTKSEFEILSVFFRCETKILSSIREIKREIIWCVIKWSDKILPFRIDNIWRRKNQRFPIFMTIDETKTVHNNKWKVISECCYFSAWIFRFFFWGDWCKLKH